MREREREVITYIDARNDARRTPPIVLSRTLSGMRMGEFMVAMVGEECGEATHPEFNSELGDLMIVSTLLQKWPSYGIPM